MGFWDDRSGAASCTYLVLYTLMSGLALYTVTQKGIRSTYTMLLCFCIIRMGAQASAVAFSTLGYEHWQWLVAYLVLGAEGYFTLILSSFYFLAYAEEITFGRSILHPTKAQLEHDYTTASERRKAKFLSPAGLFHWMMIPANVLVIVGGTQLSGSTIEDDDYEQKYKLSKGLRSAGQALFLVLISFVGMVNLWIIFKRKIKIYIVWATLIAWFPLFIRGIYGLLSCFLDQLNYFDFSNYGEHGMTTSFLACEYVLGATMEFIGAALLLSTYFVRNPYKKSLNHYDLGLEASSPKSSTPIKRDDEQPV